MSNTKAFLKQNKIVKGNVKYAATKSLVDEKGNPIEWEIKPLSTKESERLREESMSITLQDGNSSVMPKIDTQKWMLRQVVASVVSPDLLNAELQDSYGVTNENDLLYEMIDNPGEYNDFVVFVQKLNGFDVSMDKKIKTAKN